MPVVGDSVEPVLVVSVGGRLGPDGGREAVGRHAAGRAGQG